MENDWTKVLGFPGYRVYQQEIDEEHQQLKLWIRRKRGNRSMTCAGCGRRVHKMHEVYERQIPDLSFIHLVHLVHPSSAARTGHAAIPPLAPDPQLELLVLFVDLLLIDPIARESQHLRPVVLHDQPRLVATLLPPHLAQTSHFCVVHPWPSGWR